MFMARISAAAGRAVVVAVLAAAVWAGSAGPASAHVEVTADRPQAGATDVTVTFLAESESSSVGITALRVVLPPGVTPAGVTYLSGPPGWSLKPAADGYTVSGPAVPPGKDAGYVVKIAELPRNATSLAFKTLQTYTGGRVDRWIGIQESGGAEAENPAPVLTLTPATPVPSIAAASPSAAPVSEPAAGTAADPASEDDAAPVWPWIAGAAALVAALVSGLWWARRRRSASDARS